MRIIGIDPGLNITGYGIIETDGRNVSLKESGYIKTNAKEELTKRLAQIRSELSMILEDSRPEAMVLEKLYSHYRHPVTASLLGHARGVICSLAEEKNIPFFEYPATRVKKTTTGSGHASKIQVQKMIEHIFGAKPSSLGPLDATDAISLAVTHALIRRTKPLTGIKA